jgi:23S rRNA (uracil1939-C5)-methyltransferase/tRNA (uracil-5-)-methyltransferase
MPAVPPRKFNPHPFAYHQELEVTIESLTNLGSGLARVNDWVVFVPFALPGEKVRVRVYRNHKNYSDADLVEVIEPSADRIEPFCPLFGQCGGCQYQHLSYAAQLAWKQRQVSELLKHMAKIEFPVEEVVPSPVTTGYRSKITPHFHRPKEGRIGEIGFLKANTRNAMIDVPQCPIAMPDLNERLAVLREEVRSGTKTYKHGATLLLRSASGQVLTHPHDLAREEVAGVRFEFQAGDFFQNNPFILPAFVEHVVSEAKATGARSLIDAYCGSGLFGLCAASSFERVSGVEVSETAVVKARHNAELNGFTNCDFIAASAEHIFADIRQPADDTVIIVDPPRAGCGEGFLQQLFAFGPRAVVYVSCNPPTQMRDLVMFQQAGYELKRVRPFDLFPQTKHLECVMTLAKARPE